MYYASTTTGLEQLNEQLIYFTNYLYHVIIYKVFQLEGDNMDLLKSLKLKSITKRLGSIVISDDRIDCYVDNDKLRRLIEKKNNLLSLDSSDKKIAYGIDKPITYHISDYSFDGIVISTTDSIHFSNCTFNNEVTIARANQIVLENNNYNNSSNKFKYNESKGCFLFFIYYG